MRGLCDNCCEEVEVENIDFYSPAEKADWMDLAAAIARGDSAAAANSLNHLARDIPTISEWIAQGRASNLARPRAATPETING